MQTTDTILVRPRYIRKVEMHVTGIIHIAYLEVLFFNITILRLYNQRKRNPSNKFM